MRADRPAFLIAVSLALAAAAQAATIAPPSTVAATDAEIAVGLQAAITAARGGDCPGALATLDPLLARVTDPDRRRDLQLARVTCLGVVARMQELQAAYAELAARDPTNPVIQNLGVLIAADLGDFPLAGERLARFAEQRPADLVLVSGQNWQGISQGLVRGNRRDLRRRVSVALARAGWQPQDRPEIAEAVASDAIEALLAERAVPEARSMLARITAPEILFSMAIERSYQPLWPDIEAVMGPQAGTAIDAFAASRIEANTINPTDPLALRDAVRAFLLLGRPSDAADLAAAVPVSDGLAEEAVATILYHAQALAAEDRVGPAIDRLRSLTALDFAKTPSAAAGVIALAELYHDSDRAAEELALARAQLARNDEAFSAWGRGWLKRNEVCALSELKRQDEVRTAADALGAAAGDNEAATVEGLLCAGRSDEAAKLAIRTLERPEGASLLADQFQPAGALWAVRPSKLRDMWSVLLAREDVRAAFERTARILPKRLWPAREPRAIPRAAEAAPLADTI